MISTRLRQAFDEELEAFIARLPPNLHEVLAEKPLIVEDEPSRRLLDELGMPPGGDLLGLHSGVALTDRSVEQNVESPDQMMIFRGPIIRFTGFSLRDPDARLDELRRQIRITVLHEIGHHFGLDEDDLEALGYA